jgi:phospho-N-acetylmuramoyl-pentapeptide-transferase
MPYSEMALTFLIGLMLSLAAYPYAIPLLYRLKFEQVEREEGPASHKEKNGTPVMGGLVFIAASLLASLLIQPRAFAELDFLVVVLAFVGYGAIGFIDDYLVVVKHNNEGLKPRYKFLLQSILAIVFYLLYRNVNDSLIIVPLVDRYLDLGVWYLFVVFIMFTGESNAVNLSDGLDGLCAGLVILALIPFVFFCCRGGYDSVAVFLTGVIGSLIGYLRYNWHPARIFMGDTGSLALGGLLAAVAMVTKEEIALIFIGGVFVAEVVSVILQVGYFKITHGKRLFRMAPLHHHFELGGMSEQQVVRMFWTVGAILGAAGILIGAL